MNERLAEQWASDFQRLWDEHVRARVSPIGKAQWHCHHGSLDNPQQWYLTLGIIESRQAKVVEAVLQEPLASHLKTWPSDKLGLLKMSLVHFAL